MPNYLHIFDHKNETYCQLYAVAEPADEGDRLHQLRVLGEKQRGARTTSLLAGTILTPAFSAVVSPTATPLYDYCSSCSGTEESLSDTETETSTKGESGRVRTALSPNISILIFFFMLACLLAGYSKLQIYFRATVCAAAKDAGSTSFSM
jgi:hypothetical protein